MPLTQVENRKRRGKPPLPQTAYKPNTEASRLPVLPERNNTRGSAETPQSAHTPPNKAKSQKLTKAQGPPLFMLDPAKYPRAAKLSAIAQLSWAEQVCTPHAGKKLDNSCLGGGMF